MLVKRSCSRSRRRSHSRSRSSSSSSSRQQKRPQSTTPPFVNNKPPTEAVSIFWALLFFVGFDGIPTVGNVQYHINVLHRCRLLKNMPHVCFQSFHTSFALLQRVQLFRSSNRLWQQLSCLSSCFCPQVEGEFDEEWLVWVEARVTFKNEHLR